MTPSGALPAPTEAEIRPCGAAIEFHTEERCYIRELSNITHEPAVSIAEARVEPGVVTRWHRLAGITERYVILRGEGRMEAGALPPRVIGPGDVVIIPPGCPQRIANIGGTDLLFLAICSPRFVPDAYEDIDTEPPPGQVA